MNHRRTRTSTNAPDNQNGIVIATCSGAANTGAIATEAGDRVISKYPGTHLLCLPALALQREKPIRRVQEAKAVVVIDGCATRCAGTLVEQITGRKPDLEVELVQDFGVKKTINRCFSPDRAEAVAESIVSRLRELDRES